MGHTWTLALILSGADYIWRLTGNGATFEKNVGTSKPNCMTASETLTYQSQSLNDCDYSSASATIAAKTAGYCTTPQPESSAPEYEELFGSKFCEDCGDDYPEGIYLTISNMQCNPDNPNCWPNCYCCSNDCDLFNGTFYLERCSGALIESRCQSFWYQYPSALCGDIDCIVAAFSIVPDGGVYKTLVSFHFARSQGTDYCVGSWGGIGAGLIAQFFLGEAPAPCANVNYSGTVVQGASGDDGQCSYFGGDEADYTMWW
jgi:hypothetical protein